MAFDFEPSIILETAPQLLGGMKLTLIITLGGLLVGLLLATVLHIQLPAAQRRTGI